MNKTKWIVVIVLLAAMALFVPFVPMTQASGGGLGGHYTQTATVSPTYYAFHCGSYINSRISVQLAAGFDGFYQLSRGYTFACNYNSAQ